MSNSPEQEPRPHGERPDIDSAIRGMAFGALVAGGICLYFGSTWIIDAPQSSDAAAMEAWNFVDRAFQWWLRVVGVGFLGAAGLTAIGNRLGALLGAVTEMGFALLMVAMTVDGYLEARAIGGFDPTIILFLVLLAVAISAGRHSWAVFAKSRPVECGAQDRQG